ncbi:spore coat protein GerQ [Neobacillus pocheonensis]|uniref:Spore coat protein GerQ n=1 Tax=Neobacillus pocheonensis TaxID=363869 RepID=A0ABT0WHJ5_9BACI|nr:spore coat protein GerQ [Neobacillus pocheonensis]
MSQYYNPQGFQPYPGAGGQPGAQPGQQAYYPTQPAFPPVSPGAVSQPPSTNVASQLPGQLPIEQSYIENILRLNKGKLVTVYATFEGNSQWNAKTFKGIIEAAGRDHVILSDPQTGMRYLIPMVAVDYITFDEQIEYEYPFASAPSLGTYPPR